LRLGFYCPVIIQRRALFPVNDRDGKIGAAESDNEDGLLAAAAVDRVVQYVALTAAHADACSRCAVADPTLDSPLRHVPVRGDLV